MKATKWIVGGGAVVGTVGCFMDWATVQASGAAKELLADFPARGMDQGGPIILFFLGMPLLAALVGVIRRMGRGMGALALVGGLISAFFALVKYADIQGAATKMASAGMGNVAVAPGYWLVFVGWKTSYFSGWLRTYANWTPVPRIGYCGSAPVIRTTVATNTPQSL